MLILSKPPQPSLCLICRAAFATSDLPGKKKKWKFCLNRVSLAFQPGLIQVIAGSIILVMTQNQFLLNENSCHWSESFCSLCDPSEQMFRAWSLRSEPCPGLSVSKLKSFYSWQAWSSFKVILSGGLLVVSVHMFPSQQCKSRVSSWHELKPAANPSSCAYTISISTQ